MGSADGVTACSVAVTRGEPPKTRPSAIGAAIFIAFAVLCLGALTLVVSSQRGCGGSVAITPPGTPGGDPVAGATEAAALISWRDAGRLREHWGSTPDLDPAAALLAIDPELARRGYVAAGEAEAPREMPFDVDVPAMEGSCGVLEIISEGTARIDGADASGEPRAQASDPSALALGLCGPGPVHVDGLGAARIRVWHLPGLVPAHARATGMPADAVLAHAEAETILRARGWEPIDEALAVALPVGSSGSLSAPVAPSSGCVMWVAALVGAGRAGGHAVVDYAVDRGLTMIASCDPASGSGWQVSYSAHGADPGAAYMRPWRARASGAPTLPGTAGATLSAGSVRMAAGGIALPE